MIPGAGPEFSGLIRQLFSRPDLSGVTVRELDPPTGPALTLVYIADLMESADLQHFVLDPVARGLPALPPERLARSGCFPAPELRLATAPSALQEALLAGMAALHVDGHPAVLLAGSGRAARPREAFGPDSSVNLALIRRNVRTPALRVELIPGPRGSQNGVVYLDGLVSPRLVEAVRDWTRKSSPQPTKLVWWQALLAALRLPAVSECTAPAAVADALRRGYVAVVTDNIPGALVGPATLEQLFSGCQDSTLLPAVRRLVIWPRTLAALMILTLPAGLVAAASYHHSLMPGPFLIAMAASRQNAPLPIEGELMLIGLIGEGARAGAQLLGGRRWGLLSAIAIILAAMAGLQAGLIGPVTVVVDLISLVLLLVLPNPALARAVRIWRIFFMLAAFLLGLFGLALLFFVLLVYLAWERPFGHPLRSSTKVVTL